MTNTLRKHWDLDPNVTHLNHGSFGAAPRAVLDYQFAMQRRLEENPMRFFSRDLPGLLDEARLALAAFIGAEPEQLAFVPNASAGINAVLRSLEFGPGDELLVTSHGYGAAASAAAYVAERSGATLVTADVPATPHSIHEVRDTILTAVTQRTRLALIDHVTSSTALVFPLAAIVGDLAGRGIPTLVDGAHAPGMMDLDLRAIGAAYYTGNCHKWMCAPKGAGLLYVEDPEAATALVPVVVGWGRTSRPIGRSQFHADFDWVGTADPSAYLSVPKAIEVMGGLLPGGWAELRTHNQELVLAARRILCERLEVSAPVPAAMVGSMAIVPLPDAAVPPAPLEPDPLQTRLAERGFEVPITYGPAPTRRWLRISAQAYNAVDDYERLADAL